MRSKEKLTTGDWVGRYQIRTRVRAGGMASLFLGEKSGAAGFRRQAAIKVIHPHLAGDERYVQMFVEEAAIGSRIAHPNVARVEFFGEDRGRFYLVMEYVDGCTAGELLSALRDRKQRLPVELAAYLVIEACNGLHAAHEAVDDEGEPMDVVHRDVSPSNLLITREGRVKIIDFGVAKARGRPGPKDAALVGKIRYMSPEHAKGGDVDRRSDVFALGVVLWELLAVTPFYETSDEAALFGKVCDPQPRPLANFRDDVPDVLEHVIACATSRDACDRPATALELARRIGRAVPDALRVDGSEFGSLIERFGPESPFAAGSHRSREILPVSVPDVPAIVLPPPRAFDEAEPATAEPETAAAPTTERSAPMWLLAILVIVVATVLLFL